MTVCSPYLGSIREMIRTVFLQIGCEIITQTADGIKNIALHNNFLQGDGQMDTADRLQCATDYLPVSTFSDLRVARVHMQNWQISSHSILHLRNSLSKGLHILLQVRRFPSRMNPGFETNTRAPFCTPTTQNSSGFVSHRGISFSLGPDSSQTAVSIQRDIFVHEATGYFSSN